MEMIRVIKEMRDATNEEYPKFAIWENVRGAFSSNNGEDFRCVLEEFAHIVEADATIPKPSGKGGKWSKSGAISGNGWSLAWRLFDAQYWGVPQRRQRIALVMDFGGQRATEILFERTGVPGNPDESIQTWKEIAGLTTNCSAGNDRVVAEGQNAAYTLKIRSGCAGGGKGALVQTEKTGTLSTLQDQTLFQPVYCLAGNIIDRSETAGANGLGVKEDVSYTLNTVDRPAVVYDARGNGDGSIVPTITGNHNSRITDYTAVTLVNQDVAGSLLARDYKGVGRQDSLSRIVAQPNAVDAAIHWIVRRLTPTECERLQGFLDNWTDIGDWIDENGKKHKTSDAARYKALGNSIALPQWYWIFQKMKPYIGENPTLGSLFDGIGGFPLVFQSTYGEGTAIWGSEIESFCIAVARKHFPEKQRG